MRLNRRLAKLRVDARMGTLKERDVARFAKVINSACGDGCVQVSGGRFAVSADQYGKDSLVFTLHSGEGVVMKISEIDCLTPYPTRP